MLSDLKNVDDGGSWQKLMEEFESVTNSERQRLRKLTEIVLEGFINRLTNGNTKGTKKQKMIIEKKLGTKRCVGTGMETCVEDGEEELITRNTKKPKTGNNENTQKPKLKNQNQKPDRTLVELTALGLEPPPDMPEAFKNVIETVGGSEIKLVIQKFIQVTDLNPSQNRLSMTVKQVRIKFLSETEEEKVKNNGVIDVVFVEPCLKVSKLHLTKWDIGKTCSAYVFKTEWNDIVKNNADSLKPKAVVQIWSFRVGPESKLGFAMIKVRDGGDGHMVN
ncbi:B3 domain-containing protein At5g24050-like [Durio zibethinus]|uniref:B3 domain-containing protein At5g24050-like n=1 Tax=Durio zibethinus TaxID=66656 RepID=A0A6P6AHN3_DURZI|nr:B3 domain-containing protein At5g24050-like [Durio zibethinus]